RDRVGALEVGDRNRGSGNIARLDLLDSRRRYIFPGFGDRSVDIDAAAGVVHNINVQTRMAGIDRSPGHTEIGSETGDKDRVDLAFLQVARQARLGLLVCFHESRVAVDVVVEAL